MTVKLYDNDSHQKEFSAVVKSCEEQNGKYAVVLDKTAFFPEGGGQACDIGSLNGISVFDVQIKDGIIYHYTDEVIPVGQAVTGVIDWKRRFRNMQNHSGEHIVSGIVHSLYGYDNVGFHLGEKEVTLDFNGELNREQLLRVERIANEAVYKNARFTAVYPEKNEINNMTYRSKLELTENVRIVTVEGYDACACCAPHVSFASEIGIIKILDFFKMRGGVRVFLKCGTDALEDYNEKYDNVLSVSNLLSVKQNEIAEATDRLLLKMSEQRIQSAALKKRLIDSMARLFKAESDCTAVFEDGLDMHELQLFSDRLFRLYGGIRGVFTGSENGYTFAICGEEKELNGFFAAFKQRLSIKGGGRNGMVQGTAEVSKEDILSVFNTYTK